MTPIEKLIELAERFPEPASCKSEYMREFSEALIAALPDLEAMQEKKFHTAKQVFDAYGCPAIPRLHKRPKTTTQQRLSLIESGTARLVPCDPLNNVTWNEQATCLSTILRAHAGCCQFQKIKEFSMGLYDCDDCGSPRINTPSGSVCSHGCGKLWPKIPSRAYRINEARMLGIPFSHAEGGHFSIDGLDGLFDAGRVFTDSAYDASKSGDVVAIDGERLRVFKKIEEKAAASV